MNDGTDGNCSREAETVEEYVQLKAKAEERLDEIDACLDDKLQDYAIRKSDLQYDISRRNIWNAKIKRMEAEVEKQKRDLAKLKDEEELHREMIKQEKIQLNALLKEATMSNECRNEAVANEKEEMFHSSNSTVVKEKVSQRSDDKINFKQKYMTRLKSKLAFIKSERNKLDRNILQKMDQIIAEEIAERDCLEKRIEKQKEELLQLERESDPLFETRQKLCDIFVVKRSDMPTTINQISTTENEPKIVTTTTESTPLLIKCICGLAHNDLWITQCFNCKIWQHMKCIVLGKPPISGSWVCYNCQPRIHECSWKKAREIQINWLREVLARARGDGVNFDDERRIDPVEKDSQMSAVDSTSISGNDESSLAVAAFHPAYIMPIHPLNTYSAKFQAHISNMPPISSFTGIPNYSHFMELTTRNGVGGKKTLAFALRKSKILLAKQQMEADCPTMEYSGYFSLLEEFNDPNFVNPLITDFILVYSDFGNKKFVVNARTNGTGTDAKFVRRSCSPNAIVKAMMDYGRLRLFLCSTMQIEANSEICIPFDVDFRENIKEPNCACNKGNNCAVQMYFTQKRKAKSTSFQDSSSSTCSSSKTSECKLMRKSNTFCSPRRLQKLMQENKDKQRNQSQNSMNNIEMSSIDEADKISKRQKKKEMKKKRALEREARIGPLPTQTPYPFEGFDTLNSIAVALGKVPIESTRRKSHNFVTDKPKEMGEDTEQYFTGPPQGKRRRQIRTKPQMHEENFPSGSESPMDLDMGEDSIPISVVDHDHSYCSRPSDYAEHSNREESSPALMKNSESVGAATIVEPMDNIQNKIKNLLNRETEAGKEVLNCGRADDDARMDAEQYFTGPPQAKRRRQCRLRTMSQMQEQNLATNSENPTGAEEVPIPIISVVDQPNSSDSIEHTNRVGSSPHHKKNSNSKLAPTLVDDWAKKLKKLDGTVTNSKEQIKVLFHRFPIQNIRLFDEYDELREKFATEPENGQLFQSVCEKAEALKLLEDIFRYTELVLFEVKKDEFLRRSERNYISWAEEQRRQLFAKIPALKLNVPSVTKSNLLQFFNEHRSTMKTAFFHLLSENQIEMLEKFAAKIVSINI